MGLFHQCLCFHHFEFWDHFAGEDHQRLRLEVRLDFHWNWSFGDRQIQQWDGQKCKTKMLEDSLSSWHCFASGLEQNENGVKNARYQ